MYQKKSTYELAKKFENSGYFLVAYPLFKECLKHKNHDPGEIFFHCGWCLENSKDRDERLAINYYIEAGKSKSSTLIKMKAFFRAGMLFMNLNNSEDATQCFKRVIEIGHNEGEFGEIYNEAIYRCAECLESEKRYSDAFNLFRAVELQEYIYDENAKNIGSANA